MTDEKAQLKLVEARLRAQEGNYISTIAALRHPDCQVTEHEARDITLLAIRTQILNLRADTPERIVESFRKMADEIEAGTHRPWEPSAFDLLKMAAYNFLEAELQYIYEMTSQDDVRNRALDLEREIKSSYEYIRKLYKQQTGKELAELNDLTKEE